MSNEKVLSVKIELVGYKKILNRLVYLHPADRSVQLFDIIYDDYEGRLPTNICKQIVMMLMEGYSDDFMTVDAYLP